LATRQRKAVIHAPTPKKKITNPGRTSSSKKRTSPIMNQTSSGLDKIDVLIIINLRYWRDIRFAYSKDIIKRVKNSKSSGVSTSDKEFLVCDNKKFPGFNFFSYLIRFFLEQKARDY
jgi:hypothetical protein